MTVNTTLPLVKLDSPPRPPLFKALSLKEEHACKATGCEARERPKNQRRGQNDHEGEQTACCVKSSSRLANLAAIRPAAAVEENKKEQQQENNSQRSTWRDLLFTSPAH